MRIWTHILRGSVQPWRIDIRLYKPWNIRKHIDAWITPISNLVPTSSPLPLSNISSDVLRGLGRAEGMSSHLRICSWMFSCWESSNSELCSRSMVWTASRYRSPHHTWADGNSAVAYANSVVRIIDRHSSGNSLHVFG